MTPHPYAVDSNEHQQVIFKLIVPTIILAVVIIVVLNWLLDLLGYAPSAFVQALVSAPSALGICGWFVSQIEQRYWRHPWVRRALGIQTPDLNGTWEVSGVSYNPDWPDGHPWSARMRISQSWTSISLAQDAEWSFSVSNLASICIAGPGGQSVLTYQYHNRPKAGAYPTMKAHDGLVQLRIESADSSRRLAGEYYSHPRDRSNHGSMTLTPV